MPDRDRSTARRRARAPKPRRARRTAPVVAPTFTADDQYLLNEGMHLGLHDRLGAHVETVDGVSGARFGVWAPAAKRVSVVGSFNAWDPARHPMHNVPGTGVWETFIPELRPGVLYKFHIASKHGGRRREKADPFGFRHERPPRTASVVWDLEYAWNDDAWLAERARRQAGDAPVSIYEVHPGSWRRRDGDWPSYRELADRLVPYVVDQGYTHIELLPVMEHPFYGSWGYQVTGQFAPSSRYGTPQEFMEFVDRMHHAGVGVLLDWVPAHFPADAHGLAQFDGTHLYEHADPRQGHHPDWKTCIYNYNVGGVVSMLLSSALFWLTRYHVDGLRVDAVASMLYLDYSRDEGQWIPNRLGGRENLEAIDFLRRFNRVVHEAHPGVLTIAEESTSWPGVSRPEHLGGLGFDMKWDMGWMHDTLDYASLDPIHRKFHHGKLTFRAMYAESENFVLALSHDEVVHGKRSLAGKMPGDRWKKLANLKALYAWQYAQPGKKLLFMGGELAQWREWDHDSELDWNLLENPDHDGVRRFVADLNRAYRAEPALHRGDFTGDGFEWIDCADIDNSVLVVLRSAGPHEAPIVVACNFTPLPRHDYRIGLPRGGTWTEILNSDAAVYGGSGLGNYGTVETEPVECHGRSHSAKLTLPPLAAVFLRGAADAAVEDAPTHERADAGADDAPDETDSGATRTP